MELAASLWLGMSQLLPAMASAEVAVSQVSVPVPVPAPRATTITTMLTSISLSRNTIWPARAEAFVLAAAAVPLD